MVDNIILIIYSIHTEFFSNYSKLGDDVMVPFSEDNLSWNNLLVQMLSKTIDGQIEQKHLYWFISLSKEARDRLLLEIITLSDIKPWKDLMGDASFSNGKQLVVALQDNENPISHLSHIAMDSPNFNNIASWPKLALVKIEVSQLGFREGAQQKYIFRRAMNLGLQLCPKEVGPILRLNYTDQPSGESIFIASEEIFTPDGEAIVFELNHNQDEMRLDHRLASPERFWNSQIQWVFVRPTS